MKKLNIHSVIRKKEEIFTFNTTSCYRKSPQKRFLCFCAKEKWVTDVTEFKIPGTQKKLYLSAILDLYDRYPVAHVISVRNDNRLVFKTFDKAIESNQNAKPIFHSDRGFRYGDKVFQKTN